MTNRSKTSGTAFENWTVARARAHGLRAHRQPGSGILKDHPNDIVVEGWLGECKTRTEHPTVARMMEWLEGVQANAKKRGEFVGAFLVYNQKRSRKPVVVIALDDFLALLQGEPNT